MGRGHLLVSQDGTGHKQDAGSGVAWYMVPRGRGMSLAGVRCWSAPYLFSDYITVRFRVSKLHLVLCLLVK